MSAAGAVEPSDCNSLQLKLRTRKSHGLSESCIAFVAAVATTTFCIMQRRSVDAATQFQAVANTTLSRQLAFGPWQRQRVQQ
eukprot:3579051-Alexandrium_andersonii.AAC.1